MAKKMYSKKATGMFIVFALSLVTVLVYVSQSSDLFKGQLILNQTDSVTIELNNCPNDACANPGLFVTNTEDLKNIEILVKKSDTTEVVYAEYLNEMPTNSRYEVSFEAEICGQYSYDGITYQYNLDAESVCQTNTDYEFIVSGTLPEGSPRPLITEAYRFQLTE